MQWEPDHHGWMAYIKFELRGGEVARARNIYERYVACIPSTKGWVRYAKFEAENGDLGRSRKVYERALQVRSLLPYGHSLLTPIPVSTMSAQGAGTYAFGLLHLQLQIEVITACKCI
jgi:hypothetical protein